MESPELHHPFSRNIFQIEEDQEDLEALLGLSADEINVQALREFLEMKFPELCSKHTKALGDPSGEILFALETRIRGNQIVEPDLQNLPALSEEWITADVAFEKNTGLDLTLLYGHALLTEWNQACIESRDLFSQSDALRRVQSCFPQIPGLSLHGDIVARAQQMIRDCPPGWSGVGEDLVDERFHQLACAHWYSEILRSVFQASSPRAVLDRFQADHLPHPDLPDVMVPNLFKRAGISFASRFLRTRNQKIKALMALQEVISGFIMRIRKEASQAFLAFKVLELELFPGPDFFYACGFPAESYANAFDTLEKNFMLEDLRACALDLERTLNAASHQTQGISPQKRAELPADLLRAVDFVRSLSLQHPGKAIPFGFLLPSLTTISDWANILKKKHRLAGDEDLARSEEYQATKARVDADEKISLIKVAKLAEKLLSEELEEAVSRGKRESYRFSEGCVKDPLLFTFLDRLMGEPNVYVGRNAVLSRNARGFWMIIFDHPTVPDSKAGYVFDDTVARENRLLSPKVLEPFTSIINALQHEIRERRRAFFQQYDGQDISPGELKTLGIRLLPHMRIAFDFRIKNGVLTASRKTETSGQSPATLELDVEKDQWKAQFA